jgi:dCTP deaminase
VAVLTGTAIKEAIRDGRIRIDPFDESLINPNSVDVRLGPKLLYKSINSAESYFVNPWMGELSWSEWDLSDKPFVVDRTLVVLGSTVERTYTPFHVPMIEGKSSLGRQFVSPHFTAGFGDVGFNGEWCLEIHSLLPFTMTAGMRIGQIVFHTIEGDTSINYGNTGRYNGQSGPTPARKEKLK